jgi:hypothetical protein
MARTEAQKIRKQYETQLAGIRKDKALSDHGKRQKIQALYEDTQEKMRQLRTQVADSGEQERETLRAQLFRPKIEHRAPVSEVASIRQSYRDALSRAESAKNAADARRLMQRARRTGDSHLERAVAAIAAEKGWNQVVDSFAEQHGLTDTLSELRESERLANDPQHRFTERMTYAAPSRPPELSRSAATVEGS